MAYIQKTKIMAASPITSWQIDGQTVETVADFIFLGSKITAEEKVSFNFMVAVTVHSDFLAQENSLSLFPLFTHLFAMR